MLELVVKPRMVALARGDRGYMCMMDEWFDEYLFEITVRKKYLSPELLKVLDAQPVVLLPWDSWEP